MSAAGPYSAWGQKGAVVTHLTCGSLMNGRILFLMVAHESSKHALNKVKIKLLNKLTIKSNPPHFELTLCKEQTKNSYFEIILI